MGPTCRCLPSGWKAGRLQSLEIACSRRPLSVFFKAYKGPRVWKGLQDLKRPRASKGLLPNRHDWAARDSPHLYHALQPTRHTLSDCYEGTPECSNKVICAEVQMVNTLTSGSISAKPTSSCLLHMLQEQHVRTKADHAHETRNEAHTRHGCVWSWGVGAGKERGGAIYVEGGSLKHCKVRSLLAVVQGRV